MFALFCTVGLTVTQIAELDGDPLSELRGEQLRDVFISAEENEKLAKSTERRKTEEERTSEGLTSETNTEKKKNTEGFTRNIGEILDINKGYEEGKEERLTIGTFSKSLGEERKREEFSETDMKGLDTGRGDTETNEEGEMVKEILTDNTKSLETTNTLRSRNTGEDDVTLEKFKESDRMDKVRQEIEEERESMLVAGISLPGEIRGENVEDKGGNEERENIKNANHNELVEREKADHIGVSNLAPPLSTSSTQLVKEVEVPETIQVITHSQNPPRSPPPVHHNVPSSPLLTPTHVPSFSSQSPTHHAKVSLRFLPRSVEFPNPAAINHVSVSTVTPDEVRSSLLFEDVLTEVLHSPGHHLKQNELEGRSDPILEDVIVKNILFKPAQKELQTTGETNTTQDEFVPKVQAATPKPTEAEFITQDVGSKEPNSTSKSNENNPTAEPVELTHKPNMAEATGKPKTVQRTENDTKLTVKLNKPAPPRPQLTKPSAKTPSTRPTKSNSSSKNKTMKKSKEKKRKKDNKTQKPREKKKVVTPTFFPYFLDNYCPPECACYGR